MQVKTISVITPCWNAERLIGRTVESILDQRAVRSGRVSLEYVVCDGGSRDQTTRIVESLAGDRVLVISERDGGMYDALAKGLRRVRGDAVAYLNAGDTYFPSAFDVVADVMDAGRAEWLTGLKVMLNEAGETTRVTTPFRYKRRLMRCGAYGRRLPFVQQESTFWRRELLQLVDLDRLATLKLAGDHYLWWSFAARHQLKVVESLIGGFLVHPGQASEQIDAYRAELGSISDPITVVDSISAVIEGAGWCSPRRLRNWMARDSSLRWSGDGWR